MNKKGSATADYWCWEVCVCVLWCVVCGMWHSGSGSKSKEVDDKMCLHVTSSSTRTRK